MPSSAFIQESMRLAEDFATKQKASAIYLEEHPKLSEEGERAEYQKLRGRARSAAKAWIEHDSKED